VAAVKWRLSGKSYAEIQILKESELSWQKGNKENPQKDPELIAEKLTKVRGEIESGELIPCVLDECHLQGESHLNWLDGDF
jgi:hypothetical protein